VDADDVVEIVEVRPTVLAQIFSRGSLENEVTARRSVLGTSSEFGISGR
jgi:hypothetical protein